MTRIIAGSHGGRRLATIRGSATRPTSDRVREAVFAALTSRGLVQDARVLDLYAGTGALALEARSRGAGPLLLVEQARRAVAAIARSARDLGMADVEVVTGEVLAVLRAGRRARFDLVLLDPPYAHSEAELAHVLAALVEHQWLSSHAVVLAERSARSPEPTWPPGLRPIWDRRYGETRVWLAEVAPAVVGHAPGPAGATPEIAVVAGHGHDGAMDTVVMTPADLPRPDGGDVVELILADHRLFEDLLRQCRSTGVDRDQARTTLAEVLVAHAEAEESQVYPTLRRRDAIDAHEEEHGQQEHAEINQALLDALDADASDADTFDEAIEALAEVVNHHTTEEELTILNPARDDVEAEVRERLGRAWAARRTELLDAGCASREQVVALVGHAQDEGVLGGEEDETAG